MISRVPDIMPPCANAVDVHRAHVSTSSSPGRSLRFTTYSFQRKYLGGGRALATASHNCIPRITRRVLSHPNKRVYPGMDRLRHLLSLTPAKQPRKQQEAR